jgi:undecaprenyl-diphosphatase
VIALACFGGVFLALWGATYAFYPPLMVGLRSAVGWLAGMLRGNSRFGPAFGRLEKWRSYLPLVIALAVGTLIIVWTADAFIDIALALKEHDPIVQGVDSAVQQWIASRRTPLTSAFFATISMAAGPLGMGALVVTVLAVLMSRRRFRLGAYLAITAVGGALLNQWLKLHYLRQRPDLREALLGATGYAFPSGHAMSGTVILGALAYLASRSTSTWRSTSAALAALATTALAVGISRIYLGVHWTSDVGAGFVAGLLWLAATTTGYELIRQYRLGKVDMAERRQAASSPSRPPLPPDD